MYRDGTERVNLPATASLHDLRLTISSDLNISPDDQHISLDKEILTVPDDAVMKHAKLLRDDSKPLSSIGVRHGDIVYLRYLMSSRDPTPTLTHSMKKFSGGKMTVDDLVAKQIRMVRQDKPHVPSVSFDRHSANVFQQYINNTLGFIVPRCGMLYGRSDEDGNIYVDFIYEPPQDADSGKLILMRNELEEQRVSFIANALGMHKVGWIVAQPEPVISNSNGDTDTNDRNKGNGNATTTTNNNKTGTGSGEDKDTDPTKSQSDDMATMVYDNIEIAARWQDEEGDNFVTVSQHNKICYAMLYDYVTALNQCKVGGLGFY